MTYVIRPLPLCRIHGEKGGFTYRYFHGQELRFPVFSWFIDAGKEKILVDCPGRAEEMQQYSTLGLPCRDIRPLEDYLEELGVGVEGITTVVLTHLHYDHVAGAQRFPHATFLVQKAELAFAERPHALFRKSLRKELIEGLKVEAVDGDCQIAAGIQLLLTPGHTAGTQSVAVATAEGKAVIAGFCSVRENFFPPDPIGKTFPVIPPGIHLSSLEAYDSTLRLKEAADIIIPIHEEGMVLQKTIPPAPAPAKPETPES